MCTVGLATWRGQHFVRPIETNAGRINRIKQRRNLKLCPRVSKKVDRTSVVDEKKREQIFRVAFSIYRFCFENVYGTTTVGYNDVSLYVYYIFKNDIFPTVKSRALAPTRRSVKQFTRPPRTPIIFYPCHPLLLPRPDRRRPCRPRRSDRLEQKSPLAPSPKTHRYTPFPYDDVLCNTRTVHIIH